MDRISETFLHILKDALENRILAYDPGLLPEEWRVLFDLADKHKLGPVIYGALRGSPAEKSIGGLLSSARMRTLQAVYGQTARTEEFKVLYTRMLDAGLRPCVVKGIVCRGLYPTPEARISSDEDILVSDKDFIKAHELLLEYGLEAGGANDPGTDFEIGYRGKGSTLYIELHRSLFAPDSAAYGELNDFFHGVDERLEQQEICGLSLWTMQPGDSLLYLLLHAFKHFLHGGFGLRQVCDIMLYARSCGKSLDWGELESKLESVHAAGFAAAVFAIAGRYLGFDPAAAGMSGCGLAGNVDELPLLEDLLDAGVFGQDDVRRHSSNITLKAVSADKSGKNAGGGLLSSIFLPYSEMAKKFAFLKKYPVLLPAAWVMRVLKYRKEKPGAEAAQSLRLGRERTELLIKYGVITVPKRGRLLPVLLVCGAVLLLLALVKLFS